MPNRKLRRGRIRLEECPPRPRARSSLHADPPAGPNFKDRIQHFEQKARAIFNHPTVLIGALIRGLVQELVDKADVSRLRLDAIESCLQGNVGRNV